MTAQTSAGRVTDLEFPDQDRILETTLVEISQCLEVVIELLPIESDSLLKYRCRAFWCGITTVGLKSILKKALMSGAIKNRTDDAEVAALKRLPAGSRRDNVLILILLLIAIGFQSRLRLGLPPPRRELTLADFLRTLRDMPEENQRRRTVRERPRDKNF